MKKAHIAYWIVIVVLVLAVIIRANAFNLVSDCTGNNATNWTALGGWACVAIPQPVAHVPATPTRTINTAFQPSTANDIIAFYSVTVSCSSPLLAGQNTTITAQYADNIGMSTNLKTMSLAANSAGGVLSFAGAGSGNVGGVVPVNKWVKISSSTTGSACTVSAITSQETPF